MIFVIKIIKRFIPFIIPSLLMALVFISSNQQIFFVDDNLDSDAGSVKIKTLGGHSNFTVFHLDFYIPDQNTIAPLLIANNSILPLTVPSINDNIFINIRQHAPPTNFGA